MIEQVIVKLIRGGGLEAHNLLILHESAVGDFVVITAMIREIRRLYPNAYIALVIDKRAENFASLCPYVNEIFAKSFVLDNGQTLQFAREDIPNIIAKLRFQSEVAKHFLMRRYDICFAMIYGVNTSTPLLAYMSGAARRISHYVGLWKPLLTDVVSQRNKGAHAADTALSYVEYLSGSKITNRRLEAWFSDDDLNAVRELIPHSKKIYGVGIGGWFQGKHYPPSMYAELLNLIMQSDNEVHFVILGGLHEIDQSQRLMAQVSPERVTDLTGKISYRQTAAALSLCNLHIGNDTSSLHIAAGVGLPILLPSCCPIGFKRRGTTLERWHPYEVPSVVVCPRVPLPECRDSKSYRGCRISEPHCITQISPKAMFKAYKLLQDRIAHDDRRPMFVAAYGDDVRV